MTHPEGPFGEWAGYYTGGVREFPVVNIEAIYHRNDPILLGVPPMGAGPDEMARYRAVMRSALIKQNMANAGVPGVQQVWRHEIGGSAHAARRVNHAKISRTCRAGCDHRRTVRGVRLCLKIYRGMR